MMQEFNNFLSNLDSYIGGSTAFVVLLLGTGIVFTLYLGFPQIRYFRHAIRVVRGKYDRKGAKGDTTHLQALATALSGTVGTGNIAGVALAIFLGGPAALFWMLVTAFLGMTTKFVEVLLSHKYREFDDQGKIAGGPMYYMKACLNIKSRSGKQIKTGYWLGGIFAVSTIFCSFGTGSLPQINSISNIMFSSFGINKMLIGAILSLLLGLVIVGGISRIAKVTVRLVPAMAIIYFIGAIAVLITNYQNILPSLASIFTDVFTGTAAVGGFLGATIKYAMDRGVNRGLFSNEAGQGSAPIAHATARANEPVSEGMVAILGPFIDTIIICTITGLTILTSGVWKEKHENHFQPADTFIVEGIYQESNSEDKQKLLYFFQEEENQVVKKYSGELKINEGRIMDEVTVLNSRSIAEDILVWNEYEDLYTGSLLCEEGHLNTQSKDVYLTGLSLIHSAPLTALAFTRGLFGDFGKYIVSIGLLLFAFSTAISWSYYGDRAVTYLWSAKYVTVFRLVYVAGFFVASFMDTTIIWTFSGITIALMAIPNLIGILILHKEVKTSIKDYWENLRKQGIK